MEGEAAEKRQHQLEARRAEKEKKEEFRLKKQEVGEGLHFLPIKFHDKDTFVFCFGRLCYYTHSCRSWQRHVTADAPRVRTDRTVVSTFLRRDARNVGYCLPGAKGFDPPPFFFCLHQLWSYPPPFFYYYFPLHSSLHSSATG